MKTLIDMAREANDYATAALGVNAIPREWRALRDKQFAAIVRDDERRAIYVELDKTDSAVDEVLAEYKAAMQMALEASEALMAWCVKNVDKWDFPQWDYMDAANERLRAALAQPQDNLNCKSVQARLATSWGYVKAPVSDYDREFWGDGQPQGEWVDLTDDDKSMLLVDHMGPHALIGEMMNLLTAFNIGVEAAIAKFKSKNTPPVVPQGEPKYWTYMVNNTWRKIETECPPDDAYDEGTLEPLYTTPPSVEAAIAETKEKAAKLCDWVAAELETDSSTANKCAAAIRSMGK